MTATAGSDVVQSGHLIFDDFFQHLWPYISNNTANVVFQRVKRPKREIRRSPNVSFNKSIVARAVTCCAVLLKPQLLDIMIVQFRNEKEIMALYRSPLTVTLWPSSFLKNPFPLRKTAFGDWSLIPIVRYEPRNFNYETTDDVSVNGEEIKSCDVIEEVVGLARQINLEVGSDDSQELLDSHNLELTKDELIEMHE
ncbi:hypothetical protein TNCV_3526181 [Trichonephila clavipes]|nr:hypothetical protein TNCV_3526181 [Trichonephila clavipes]